MNKVPYAIPKQNEGYLKSPENYAEERVKDLCNNIERVRKNAKLVDGCSGIQSENKFVILLDEGYLSFLIGLYHSTVSICSIAMERLCYDLVDELPNTIMLCCWIMLKCTSEVISIAVARKKKPNMFVLFRVGR